mgnify:CR=1 FL=1
MSDMNKEQLMCGLSDSQVNESKAKYGTNELAKKETESLWSMFIGAFDDIWIKVLCAALALKVILAILGIFVPALSGGNDVVEIISIVIAIALATGFSTLSEYRNTSRSEALQEEYSKTYAKVMRNGKLVNILTSEIVKGDTILVQAGDKVPADGLIFEGKIKVSQAALNGESRDENKAAVSDMADAESTDYSSVGKVFMGSVVTSGEGYMVATVIGDNSELGKINKALTDTDEEEERKDTSSLKLEGVAAGIGKLGVSAAAIAGILHVVLTLVRADEAITVVSVLLVIAEAVMLMASIVIMAVPEGLPMMNSLVQSMNTESMYKKNILVSHKAAFSDSAYMNVLFSDKTGTITQGNLSLVEFITGNGEIVDSIQSSEFIEAITLNNLAKISSEGKAIGSNNMDRALLGYALEHGYDDSKNDPDKVADISGFDSEKKCATVTLKNGLVYWKGATENIIDKVTHYMLPSGEEKEFTAADKKAVEDQMLAQAKRTMKLLSVAKIADGKTVLMAVLCLRDNVRTDAVETVEILNNAGIQVVMVTGDAEETAVAIAKEAGILKDEQNDVVLTHEELEQMSDEELKKKLPNLRVVSRAKPLDKKRLVSISQQLDNVCGMTGDGVNDAPALKQADIGVAMGGTGTEVAKDAADMVLTNDNFSTIVSAVKNGRNLYQNILHAIEFLLSGNMGAILTVLTASITGLPVPFAPVHLLFINLLTDSLPAIALGLEPDRSEVMSEKPRLADESILTKDFLSKIGLEGLVIGAMTMISFLTGYNQNGTLLGSTYAFGTLCLARLFHGYNCKSDHPVIFTKGLFHNKWLQGAFVLGTVLITTVLTVPGFHNLFKVETLNLMQLGCVYLYAFASLLIIQLLKCIRMKLRKRGKR